MRQRLAIVVVGNNLEPVPLCSEDPHSALVSFEIMKIQLARICEPSDEGSTC